MATRSFVAVILAAGYGKRMKSTRPKVLHPVAGRPMVRWSVDAAFAAGAEEVVVVVGHGRERVEQVLREEYADRARTVVQETPRGTGDAVRCALPELPTEGDVLIGYGDCPLVSRQALHALVEAKGRDARVLAMLVSSLREPHGYGRIIRAADEKVVAVREERDCTPDERTIREVNPGLYLAGAKFLREAVEQLSEDNAQGELYLTDIVAAAGASGGVADLEWPIGELTGVNDRWELAQADHAMRMRIIRQHARAGVTLRAPETISVDADVTIEADVTLESQVTLRGECRIGAGARIDVGAVLEDVTVAANAWVKPYTVASNAVIGPDAHTGPFAHLRPGTELGPQTRIGNFVETKKTRMGAGSKANHLAYLGDGEVAQGVNIGAGVIFCNYDGVQKHVTTLRDGCFIGSDSQLVAPVTVGKQAYVATGTTVTMDVPDDALAVGRVRQENKANYASRLRARLEGQKRTRPK